MDCDISTLALLDLRHLMQTLLPPGHRALSLEPEEWLGVVELLTMRTIDECMDLRVEEWDMLGEVVDYIFDHAETSGAISCQEASIRRLNLSTALLDRVPSNSRIDILNPSKVIDLLLRELPISIEDARIMAPRWKELNVDQVRMLRLTKNLLSPVVVADFFLKDARVAAWVEVFPMLP